MKNSSRNRRWPVRLALITSLAIALWLISSFFLSRSDGPVFIFAGGPLQSGENVELSAMNWNTLDAQHELEMELVGEQSSLTLWFSVHDGIPYVACDLDCVDGVLARWPQKVQDDNRVVVRINDMRSDGRVVHVPHGTGEYKAVRAGRNRKYSGGGSDRAAAETAAHSAVVGVGETLTGRSQREEPGDRIYRIDPR